MITASSVIGAILVLIGFGAAGFSAASMYRLRSDQLEAFIRLIRHIRESIDYCLAPLDSILDGYESDILSGCGFLLTAREVGARSGYEFCRGRLLISPDASDLLEEFFRQLGSFPADEESRRCAYYERLLSDELEKERAELPKRAKLARSFGLLGGFLVALLLL